MTLPSRSASSSWSARRPTEVDRADAGADRPLPRRQRDAHPAQLRRRPAAGAGVPRRCRPRSRSAPRPVCRSSSPPTRRAGWCGCCRGRGSRTSRPRSSRARGDRRGCARPPRRWAGELRQVGVNLDLAPVLDTVPGRRAAKHNPPIGGYDRQFGYTPEIVTEHGLAFVRGMADGGVAHGGQALPRPRPGARQHRHQCQRRRPGHPAPRPLPGAVPGGGRGGRAVRDDVDGALHPARPEAARRLLAVRRPADPPRRPRLRRRGDLRRPQRRGAGLRRPPGAARDAVPRRRGRPRARGRTSNTLPAMYRAVLDRARDGRGVPRHGSPHRRSGS